MTRVVQPAAPPTLVPTTRITGCRSCGSRALRPIIDLGPIPLANRLVAAGQLEEPEPRVPLELVFCERCTLVQITKTVAPEALFRDYPYFSSFSDGVLAHSRAHVDELLRDRRLGPDDLVVEVASNDGYLLQYLVAAGVPCLGIEPALNVAARARERGVPTRTDFFGAECVGALRAEGRQAAVVLGNNVLAHVANLGEFVDAARDLLAPRGIVEFEFPYVASLIDETQFDTIYHEHLCYFSAHAIETLFARHGLVFTDVRRIPIHGGSLRVTGARQRALEGRARVEALLDEERRRGMDRAPYYETLARRVDHLRRELLELLTRLRADGRRVVGYAASAKGCVLANCFGIGRNFLEYVVDRSSVKQGWFTPGTHLEICAPERLLDDRPDFALLLAWNFADEIVQQNRAYLAAGGRFIVPIPELRIIGG